ncbi:MAG: pre-peptidase C-terminal domain-containing protein, partial [Lentisphaerota bacterium]
MNPQSDEWYIMVYGYEGYEEIKVNVSLFTDVPGIPANFTATTGGQQILLEWNASTGTAASSYDVYRSRDNAPQLAELVKNTSDLLTVDTAAVAGTHYYYWVRGRNVAGASGVSGCAQGWLSESAATALKSGTAKTAISGGAGSTVYYSITIPAAPAQVLLEIKAYGGTGDCDLTVIREGVSYYGVKTTNNETVLIENPTPGGVYQIALYANTEYSGLSLTAKYYSATPPPPTGVSASAGTYPDAIRVSWAASPGAESYEVWRGTTPDRGAVTTENIGEVSDTSYMDSDGLLITQNYYYWIRAKNPNPVPSAFNSKAALGYISKAPANIGSVKVSNGTYFDSIALTWPKSAGATSYSIWRTTVGNPAPAVFIANVPYDSTKTNYTYNDAADALNPTPDPADTYTYEVTAINDNGTSFPQPGTSAGSIKKTGPAGVMASNGTYAGRVKITWKAVAGATGYNVYRTDVTAVPPAPKPAPLNPAPVAETVYYDTTAVAGTSYTYWVDADYNRLYQSNLGAGSNGKVSDAVVTNLAAPVVKSVSKGEGAFVKIVWAEVPLATAYNVFWKLNAGDEWVRLKKDATELTYTNLSATAGQTYMYCVNAVNGGTTSAYSAAMSGYAAGALAAPVIETDTYAAMSLSGGARSQKVYQITVPAGVSRLVVKAWNVTGSCDLYAKLGMYPTTANYNAKGASMKGSADKTLTVTNPAEGTWYVLLYGSGAAGYKYTSLSIDYYTSSDIIFTQVPPDDLAVPFTAVFKGRVLDRSGTGIPGLNLQVRDPLTGLQTWLPAKTDSNGYFT